MSSLAKDTKTTVVPSVRYRDERAAIQWLCEVFGFERQLVVPNEDGSVAHAQLSFGNGMVMLGAIGAETHNVYVVVSDADSLYARVESAGAEILREIRKRRLWWSGLRLPRSRGSCLELRHLRSVVEVKNAASKDARSPSELITDQIEELADWRGSLLAQLRRLILDAAPEVTEAWKWGTAVWVHRGNVVAAGAFKDHVKLNFFKGASLDDPSQLFNAGLEAKATRAIDFHQADKVKAAALKGLVRAAAALNAGGGNKKRK